MAYLKLEWDKLTQKRKKPELGKKPNKNIQEEEEQKTKKNSSGNDNNGNNINSFSGEIINHTLDSFLNSN